MTQALINNLNIITQKTATLEEKMPKTEGIDFGKIFEAKKDTTDKQSDSNQNLKTIPCNTNTVTDTKSCNTQENANTDTNNDSKNTKNDNLSLDTAINTVVQEFSEENNTKSDAALKVLKDEIELQELNIINAIVEENTEPEDITPEDITDDNTDTNKTTITEEEPTMYNELNALEDPTAVLLLQSQIQKTVKTTLENEPLENSQTQTNTKTNDSLLNNNSNNTAIFKQFDNTITKDVSLVNVTPKDNSHSKDSNAKPSNIINENIIKELNVEVVSSKSADTESSMSDLMQNQSPQEQAARVMIQGDIKYESVASETVKNTVEIKNTNVTPGKIIEQISKQLENMFNNSKLNMVLNPGTLGKVNLQLVNSKEGLLAQFTVTTQDARDLLMKGLDGLKESLLAQGVNVDNVSIKLEETESDYHLDYTEQEGSKGGYKHHQAKKQKDNEKDFEQMMFDKENEENV